MIPEELHQFHDVKLKQYVLGEADYSKPASKSIYALSRNSSIVYSSVKTRILPDISQGISVISFIDRLPIDSCYLVCKAGGEIVGVSEDLRK